MSSLSRSKKVFGKNVKFLVNGISTNEYDPKTFYEGELQGVCVCEIEIRNEARTPCINVPKIKFYYCTNTLLTSERGQPLYKGHHQHP